MLVSLLSFILFEVYKSFFVSKSVLSLHRAIADLAHFVQRLQDYELERQRRDLQMAKVRASTFWFTLLTGLAAGLALISVVVHGIFLRYAGS
jgi:hypothetical protein